MQNTSTSVQQAIPDSVARYFAFSLPMREPRITKAHAEWSGTFLMRRGARSVDFTAHQHFIIRPPGFVWQAKMAMFPGISMHVLDSYRDGRGTTRARIAGAIPVMNQPGTPETAEAALQRFLGEAIWFPTALLPSAGVTWTPVDADSATATLADRGNVASIDFHFGDEGSIVGCSALRQRDVGSRSVLTPWRTRTWDYRSVDGIMVPHSAEAEWLLPDGPLTYWRGTLERLTYEFAAENSSHVGER
jgi:hypothetical protein